MNRVAASEAVSAMRLALGSALLCALLAPGTAWAEVPDCGNVLTDTSRSIAARRALANQCLVSACRQEAQELQLAPDATARYIKMCVVDDAAQSLAGEPAGSAAAAPAGSLDIACAAGENCSDPSLEFEATASGVAASGRASPGHTFVRVPRINETIER